mgnify:CR=1 FL=1
MGKAFKVIVTGAFNAGKTEFVRSASDIDVVNTDRRVTDALAEIKDTTTVAMDYGQVTVDGNLFHLFGTPGQERFEFMWDILGRDTDAVLLLVDSVDRISLTVTRRMLRFFRRKARVPVLIVATKQDLPGAMPAAEIGKRLGVEPSVPIVSCDPRRRESALEVMRSLSRLMG